MIYGLRVGGPGGRNVILNILDISQNLNQPATPRFKSLITKFYNLFILIVYVQLAFGGRGHVTQHMRDST